MTKKKSGNKISTAVAIGLGLATLSGGAYYYFGPKGEKHQKEAKTWMKEMKIEIEGKLKKAKNTTSNLYHDEVDNIATKYSKKYKDYANEINIFAKNLKGEWKDAQKNVNSINQKNKKIVKKH